MMKDLSMHIMDIAQNSVRAEAAAITVAVDEDSRADRLTITVVDDGKGMPPEVAAAVRDPFFTTRVTRSIGLGLPMLDQTCRQCGGEMTIESRVGAGTTVTARMRLSHIDRPPLGDAPETARLLMISNEGLDITYRHSVDGHVFEVSTAEVKEALDGVPLTAPAVMRWLQDYIDEGVKALRDGGVA